MKYTKIYKFNDYLELYLCCSGCGQDLHGTERFCPNCGKALRKRAIRIDADQIVDLLNKVGLSAPSAVKPNEESSAEEVVKIVRKQCPCCKSSSRGCEFLQPDGKCHGVCYPTYPPQYDDCIFNR